MTHYFYMCLLLVSFARTMAATSLGEAESDCGLTDRGIEVTPVGQIEDQMGEVTMVAQVELSAADPQLLRQPLPDVCRESQEEEITQYCHAIKLDLDRFKKHIEAMGTIRDVAHRRKRQAVAVPIIAAGVLGYLSSKLSGDSSLSELSGAVERLRSNAAAVATTVHKVKSGLFAVTALSLANDKATHALKAEIQDHRGRLQRLAEKQTVLDGKLTAMTELFIYQTLLGTAKDAIDNQIFLAAQRYDGLISGQGQRLSPSVVPPDLFWSKLEEIRSGILTKYGEHINFGSKESAYVATRVDFTDIRTLHEHNLTRVVAEVVWRTPFVSEGQTPAQLYRLRAHPFRALFHINGTQEGQRVRTELRAPYLALRADNDTLYNPRLLQGEFYQLIDEEDVRDRGNGSFINLRPSAWVHSSDSPSCEYASVRHPLNVHPDDLCLQRAKPVKYVRGLETLESGCWLLASEGKKSEALRETCRENPSTPRYVRTEHLGSLFLFRPKCGCRYSSAFRDYPMAGSKCTEKGTITLDLPAATADDLFNLFLHQNPTFFGRFASNGQASRKKRSVDELSQEEQMAAVQAILKRLNSSVSVDDTAYLQRSVAAVAERIELEEKDGSRSFLLDTSSRGSGSGWEELLNWRTLEWGLLVVCMAIFVTLVFMCYVHYRNKAKPRVGLVKASKDTNRLLGITQLQA